MSLLARWIWLGLLGAAQCAAQGPGSVKGVPFDKNAIETYVRHLLVWTPDIAVRISALSPSGIPGLFQFSVAGESGPSRWYEQFYLTADGRSILHGPLMNLTESPFAQNLRRLHTEGVPEEGPSSARVTIVEFTDFQCESCSVQAKMLDDELRQAFPGHVRLYAKDFPLKGVHDWAFQAAVAGACAYEQGNAHFWVYRRWVFDHQEEMSSSNINAKVLEFARQDRLHTQDLRACMSSSAATNAVQASIAEAQALNLSGTPTLFINGRRLDGSRRWSEIQAIIRFELDNTQAAGDAKCLCGPN